jgi:hypothetical protein
VNLEIALAEAEAALAEAKRAEQVQLRAVGDEIRRANGAEKAYAGACEQIARLIAERDRALMNAQSLGAALEETGRQWKAAVGERDAALGINRRLLSAFGLARPYFEVLLAQADNEDADVKGIVQNLFAAVEDAS